MRPGLLVASRAVVCVVAVAVVGCQQFTGTGPSAGGPESRPVDTTVSTPAPGTVPGPSPAPSEPDALPVAVAPASLPVGGPPAPSVPTRPPTSTQPAPAAPPVPAAVPVAGGRIRPGVVYSGPATFHNADGSGNCLFDPLTDPAMPVAAMNQLDYENSRACGAYIEVTGPHGKVVVKITNRCPECAPGHVDMSRQAFSRIADPVSGIVNVTWRLVSPADLGPVQYRLKEGSSKYWLAIQARNHRNPVASLEVQVGGSWQALPREMYNHFLAPQGLGAGPFTVRLTDIYGEQLVHTINLAPATVQTTSTQFARH